MLQNGKNDGPESSPRRGTVAQIYLVKAKRAPFPEAISDNRVKIGQRGLPLITYAARGRGSSLLYISIAYYMQKGCIKRGVRACSR